ncbi:transcription-repair coupling factor [Legionella geestiana]|nr:transcription-repair coupling factor [Legionella geestiana]QBS11399.1 transcription-repair coupling factor [Legionella geestiana]STX53944.1 transcription-repair coupling factor [Legionella geestiana]
MPPFLLNPPQSGHGYWSHLARAALPLALAEYWQQNPGVMLVVTTDNNEADALTESLRFFLPKDTEILTFPDRETLPYDHFSPHEDILSERLSTLSRLKRAQKLLVVSAFSTLMHRLCPPEFLHQHLLVLNVGDTLNPDTFREQLTIAGYQCVSKVLEHGEYALRGAILDIFPMGSTHPFRIELFDNTIESLRCFDAESQRTIEKIDAVRILPAREFGKDSESIGRFRGAWREAFSGNPSQSPVYTAVSEGQLPGGIEYYLPLFFEKTATIADYLPEDAHIFLAGDTRSAGIRFEEEIDARYEQLRHDLQRPLLPPPALFQSTSALEETLSRFQCIHITATPPKKARDIFNFNTLTGGLYPANRKSEQPLETLAKHLQTRDTRFLLMAESAGRREVLQEMLSRSGIRPGVLEGWVDFLQSTNPVSIVVGPLAEGVVFKDAALEIIVESQLFGEQAVPQSRRSQKTIDPDLIIRSLAELREGSPVVHLQFGVGRYEGLQYIESGGTRGEFLVIRYANDDKIYVPVTSLHLVSRYTGLDSEHAPLHRLGTDQWQKEKKKAAEKIRDTAAELLDIYARREASKGVVSTLPATDYALFAAGFPFTETRDQAQAIDEIVKDMQSTRPMDRLICGDVGFGKTEVAMRAAFIAVQNGHQVCVLVPTTLLAAQHYDTFRDRFADFPVNIALLSRFNSGKEATQVIEGMQSGRIDIVIGTHKLFSANIVFKRLGLLIIDEEHRFGVKQKEHIRALRAHVDVLSMTATPIPRTLNMSMTGIRDISLIATPPARRLAIKTFWQQRNDTTLREAVLREILRGGQVYFLHNNVQSIAKTTEDIQTLVPEARVQFAHGQMRERELERIMSDFYHQRFNVLVCTTIIETGIDIPSANTIIIDRADKFGLAQLHQLRGRVGRSHHQAYAWLFTPDKKLLTSDAIKRLEAIVSLEDLGAGFALATHDLEIRGAGELLGEEQSGNMQALGFGLFMEMLDEAVTALKSGKIPELANPLNQGGPDIDLRHSALLPEDYIADVHTRLVLYKQIASAPDTERLRALQVEMIDRFGLLPEAAKQLFRVTELKLLASKLGIKRIQAGGNAGKIEFGESANIDAAALIRLIQLHAKRYQLDGPTRLRFILDGDTPESRTAEITALLNALTPP